MYSLMFIKSFDLALLMANYTKLASWNYRGGVHQVYGLVGYDVMFHLRTYSMEQILLSNLTGSQLVKKFLIFYITRRFTQVPATSPCSEPDQPNLSTTSHFMEIHLNIIIPSLPGYSWSLLSFSFSHLNPACNSSLPYTCYMTHPSH
jgi:hypothetical protein